MIQQTMYTVAKGSMDDYRKYQEIQRFNENKQIGFFKHMSNPFIVIEQSNSDEKKITFMNDNCKQEPLFIRSAETAWKTLSQLTLTNSHSLKDEIQYIAQSMEKISSGSSQKSLQLEMNHDNTRHWQFTIQISALKDNIEDLVMFLQFIDCSTSIELAEQKGKNAMMCSISHELLNPMNSVLSISEKLFSTNMTNSDYKMLHKSSILLNLKIQDIIVYAEKQQGSLYYSVHDIPISGIIQQVYQLYEEDASQKNLQYQLSLPLDNVIIKGDPNKLGQIVNNLISNAVKYTQRSGVIKIASEVIGENLVIAIKDNGPGFNANIISNSKLAGIGLQSTRFICESLSYKLEIKSNKRGTQCRVWIPIVSIAIDKSDEIPSEEIDCLESKMLYFMEKERPKKKEYCYVIVDDCSYNRYVIRTMLQKIKGQINIIEAEDGQIAVEEIRKVGNSYNMVVFMDVEMPNMNGIEATKWIMNYRKMVAVQIIVVGVTAFANTPEQQKCYEVGMHYLYSKPMTFIQLKDLLLNRLRQMIQFE